MRKTWFLLPVTLLLFSCAEKHSAVYSVSTNYQGLLFIRYTNEHSGISFTKKLVHITALSLLELNHDEYSPGTHIGYNIRIEDIMTSTGHHLPFNGNDPKYWGFSTEGTVDKYQLSIDTTDFQ